MRTNTASRVLVLCRLRTSTRLVQLRRAQSTQSVPSNTVSDLEHSDDLFHYTRGRFICNEKDEMLQRHIRFDVNELGRIAAEAVGAASCVKVEKYPDGMYNKSMLLTMDNGSQVVAKVPNPNAGLPHFTTASEVATMDFARRVLGTPVPKVLAWCSRAESSPAGAEYIIMEKAPGIELERVWPIMKIKDRLAVVKAVSAFQKAWTSVSFKRFGSLYYSKDLEAPTRGEPLCVDSDGVDITDDEFAVGPSMGREWIDDGRASVEMERGPWLTLEEYHSAIGHRERAPVEQLPHLPKSPITLCGPGTYTPTRERKLKALQCYQSLIKYLLPEDGTITSAHMWHNDLHVANIFVDPSEPTKIVSLIDWQSTEIAPLYFQARQPHIIDYEGPPVYGLERPQPPKDLEKLDASAKNRAETVFLQRSLCSLYNTLTHGLNLKLYAALQFQHTTSYTLLLLARNLLIDGEATYLFQVAELESIWDDLPESKGSTYPFSFSAKDREQMKADVEGAVRGMELMRAIREEIGELFPEQGIVRHELYEEALDALRQMKEQVIAEFAQTKHDREVWEEVWPFKP